MDYAYRSIQALEQREYPSTNKIYSYGEFSLEELAAFKEKIYKDYDFENKEQVELQPSVPYDILLCTEGNCDDYTVELRAKIESYKQRN